MAGPHTLLLPDYSGNNMMLSLGNLATDPSVSLLVLDTGSGEGAQIQGSATLVLQHPRTRVVTVLGEAPPVGACMLPRCALVGASC